MVDELEVFAERKRELEKDRLAQITTWRETMKNFLERAAELREAIRVLGGRVGRKGRPKAKGELKGKGGRPPGSKNKPKGKPDSESGGGPVEQGA